MILGAIVLASAVFAKSPDLALQIGLEREGFSCNTVDGVWGGKSETALSRWLTTRLAGKLPPSYKDDHARIYREHFAGQGPLFRYVRVTKADIASLVKIPRDPAEKAKLPHLGYESLLEMFAERGHVSRRALERLNPGVDWSALGVGGLVKIPDFTPVSEYLASWPRDPAEADRFPEASLVRISLSRYEVTAYAADGSLLALFPCSIASDKSKLPSKGELRVTTAIANPNYTYTPDNPGPGPVRRHVLPAGENCPVGIVWLGLDLPGYGIHGTPTPETIGRAESHGCFRLSNWNAARLYSMVKPGTRVIIGR